MHWGINPPLKNTPRLFLAVPPPKSANAQAPPFLGNTLVFREPPLKIGFFSEPQK